MKGSLSKGLAAVLALLVLTSCGVTIGPIDPPTTDRSVTSRTDSAAPVTSVSLAPGETKVIRVSIPSAQRGVGRRLVVEFDDAGGVRQLDLVLYGSDGVTPTASTSGTAFFRPGLLGLDGGFIGTGLVAPNVLGDDQVDRSVSVVGQCFGPCIARRSDVTQVFVEVTNTSGFDNYPSVPFYAYTEPWIDEGEPQNDSLSGAVRITTTSSYRGAIERLGDVDYVRFAQSGFVAFDERPGYDVNLVLDLYSSGGVFIRSVRPGDPRFDVVANDFARIYSESPVRASVYGFYLVYYD